MGKRDDSAAPAAGSGDDSGAPTRSGTLKGGMDAREMAARSAEVRRARAAERAAQDADAALTFRQRLAVSLSRLKQEELDAAIRRMATDDRPAALTALARMADQAFGKPQPEEEEERHDDVRHLTRAQRAALMARLLREEEEQRTAAGIDADPRAADDAPPPPAPPHPRD